MGLPGSVLKGSRHTSLPPFLLPTAWNVDVRAGAPAAILDYEDESHILGVVNQ